MGLPFDQFLARTQIRPATVAHATGLHASTIIRLRDSETDPDGRTMLILNRWAADVAKTLGLQKSECLSWEHLIDSTPDANTGE